jgi:hypothetical protein
MTPVMRSPQEKPISPHTGNGTPKGIVTTKNNDPIMIHLYAHLTSKKIDHENNNQTSIDDCTGLLYRCLPKGYQR